MKRIPNRIYFICNQSKECKSKAWCLHERYHELGNYKENCLTPTICRGKHTSVCVPIKVSKNEMSKLQEESK